MLPFGGQGSNQAIEDTGALRCLFGNVEPGESLTKSLDLFDRVRRISVTRTQTMSKVRVGKEREVREELLQYADPPGSCESFMPSVARGDILTLLQQCQGLMLSELHTTTGEHHLLPFQCSN